MPAVQKRLPKYVTFDEAESIFGVRRRTIRYWWETGQISVYRFGRKNYLSTTEFGLWLEEQRMQPLDAEAL